MKKLQAHWKLTFDNLYKAIGFTSYEKYSNLHNFLVILSQDYSVASATLPHNMSSVNSDMSNHHHQTNASRSNTLNRRNSNLMAMNHNIPPPDVTHTHTTKMMPPMIVSSGASSLYSSKPNNVLPGILKDRKNKA